jgi:hypothetical protein
LLGLGIFVKIGEVVSNTPLKKICEERIGQCLFPGVIMSFSVCLDIVEVKDKITATPSKVEVAIRVVPIVKELLSLSERLISHRLKEVIDGFEGLCCAPDAILCHNNHCLNCFLYLFEPGAVLPYGVGITTTPDYRFHRLIGPNSPKGTSYMSVAKKSATLICMAFSQEKPIKAPDV